MQELTYSYGSTLWTLATYAYIVWGWKSFKGSGGLSFTAITDDMWANSDQDNGDGCNTAPAEPPSIYGIHPNSDTGITYNEWTASGGGAASYTEWDDDPTDDADTTYNESGTGLAEVKQTSEFEDSILGSDGDILGVGCFCRYRYTAGLNGALSHLLVADGSEVTSDMTVSATYRSHVLWTALTPAGNPWTEALLNGAEYGARRAGGAVSMRNLRVTMIWKEAAKGTLESPAAGTAFGQITTDTLVPASWAGGSRRFGVVPSTEVVTVGSGARRWGAVPSDELVPADSDWTT